MGCGGVGDMEVVGWGGVKWDVGWEHRTWHDSGRIKSLVEGLGRNWPECKLSQPSFPAAAPKLLQPEKTSTLNKVPIACVMRA